MMAPCFCVAVLLLAAKITMASAQESVSVGSISGVSETASNVNGVSKGSTQIASDLWTVTPTAAECPLGTTFPVQAITGVTVCCYYIYLMGTTITPKRYRTVYECSWVMQTISHIKNATADHMTLKVNMR